MKTATMSADMLDELARLAGAIDAARIALSDYRTACEAVAPAKIGDIIEVTGYSFRGKQMQVARIFLVQHSPTRWVWRLSGPVLKKDGTPGNQTGETSYEIEVAK